MESYTGDVLTRYYGRIEEIWELNYSGEKVSMFRVRWAKNVTTEDRYFVTMSTPSAKSSATSPHKMIHGYWLGTIYNASS